MRPPAAGAWARVPGGCRRRWWPVGSAAMFVLWYLLMVRTPVGQAGDTHLFRLVFGLVPREGAADLVAGFARAASVVALAVAATVLGVAALGRGLGRRCRGHRDRRGLGPVGDLPERRPVDPAPLHRGTVPPQQPALDARHRRCRPDGGGSAPWPRRRPWWLVNTAAVVLLLVAVGNIVSQAHRPSDVVASFLLVGAVAGAALALAGPPGPRH